jgi:hypothetical protein
LDTASGRKGDRPPALTLAVGGDLTVRSTMDAGTTLTLTLPAA